jgi:GTP diphosphokinase / guanosine-3',5'-bis(diphosphate) 3'-diphosphatase
LNQLAVTTGNTLLERAGKYLPPEKLSLVAEAYEYAAQAHAGQKRLSGEPFLEHPLQVALTLAELQLDATALAAALLHDVPEDCGVTLAQIQSKFGPDVAQLVDGVTKLSNLVLPDPAETSQRTSAREQQAENLRKMLVAMAEDLRVVFIKLADRLHNMRTLDALSPEKRTRIARETLEIYAPLAHRLGIYELKWQLEDMAFHYLEPEKYSQIAQLVAGKRAQREGLIEGVITQLRDEFAKVGIKADVTGRPKHLYSISQKIDRYSSQGRQFNEIYDLLAVRVLVDTVGEAYHAMGIVHNLWHPIPGSFDDYIANPKPNGYQSLHTAVLYKGTTPLEIQLRTREMHRVAEYGVAAHWRYKEGDKKGLEAEERIGWLRQLVDWHRELAGAEEFLESVKTDIFNDQVFVFTPKGEIKDLPKGSTPVDFAYRVHTELGNRCIGSKVNGRLVALDYQLKNGEVVEIMASKKAKGPSRDWLSPNLGYVQSSHAREKIRQYFKKQERDENIVLGREMLDKELKHLGLTVADRETLATLFKFSSVDDMLAAIGYGDLSVQTIALRLAQQQEKQKPVTEAPAKPPTGGVQVLGIGDLLTNLAKCCNPVPGDPITGYVTRSRGITVHRQDCYNIVHEDERERLVNVTWGRTEAYYPVNLQVEALDRVGLVRDISTIVAEEKVNITSMNVTENPESTVSISLSLVTTGLAQLSRLMSKIEGIPAVTLVTRAGESPQAKGG